MKKVILCTVITFLNSLVYSQTEQCDCAVVYDELLQKVEANYIALAQQRAAGDTVAYIARTKSFKKEAPSILPSDCTKFLQSFLNYFEDEHLFVFEQPIYSEQEITDFKTKIKDKLVSVENIQTTLDYEKNMVEKNGLDGIIGKWTDGDSEIAIIKDEGYYRAYILKSKLDSVEPGELKAQFKSSKKGFDGIYYTYGYAPKYVEGAIYKEKTLLVLTGGLYWGKIGPLSNREIAMINREDVKLPVIQKLDEDNTLFAIPSFLADYTKFIQVITDNIDLLKNTKNLIIDIRGNIGGNAIYFSFIDAYATKTLLGSQGLVLASKDTQEYFERLAKNAPEIYQPVVERIKKNRGKIIDGPKYPDRDFPPFESKIENVAILTDNGSMSAAESFVLHSKGASTKVKTFGSPTGGVIDYTSIHMIKLDSGSRNIYFGYPTSTYHKNIPQKGLNQTGIFPDVPIRDDVKDKVGFIMRYYRQN